MLGIVTFTVRIKGYSCWQPFVVVRKLATNLILCTTFIKYDVETINIRQRNLILVHVSGIEAISV